jgi:hypothetical protein
MPASGEDSHEDPPNRRTTCFPPQARTDTRPPAASKTGVAGSSPVLKATFDGGGVPAILGQLSSGMQDFLLLLIIFAFFSCGTSVQGAGSRLAFS